jgi:signal transduction histidine kinase
LAGRPHVVPDLAIEMELPVAQLIYALGVRSLVSLPLCAGSNVIGALSLHWQEVDGCHTEQMGLLTQVASAVAIAVEKGRLFAEVSAGKERLAVLSRRLMEVQESERRHLARELHDEIGQYLTGISLVLNQLERRHSENPGTTVVEVQKVVGELITRVRDLSLDLRPAMLDDLGLLPTLLWLFKHVSPNIQVDFQHKGAQRRFPPNVEIAAYRIVQEALTNVARHAGVSQARVLVAADDHHLSIGITDHGTGFDTDATLGAGTTAGLSGMRERAEFMGGRLTVESRPGAGTRVHAEFDLDRN